MKKIFKYRLDVTDVQKITLPALSDILSVQEQYGYLSLWALVDPDEKEMIDYDILIFGTGHPIEGSVFEDDYPWFLGTVQFFNGEQVYHVFMRDVQC